MPNSADSFEAKLDRDWREYDSDKQRQQLQNFESQQRQQLQNIQDSLQQ
jgi:hypothetical protein